MSTATTAILNDEAIIKKAKELIAIPSTVANPTALHDAVNLVADLLEDHPEITIERFESNGKSSFLAYNSPQRPTTFDVLFHAHIDVVAAADEQFKPYTRDGKLYGRGAHDMKTAAIVMADVFKQMAGQVSFAFGFQVVSDEETGGYDGVVHQLQQGVRTRFAITGEHSFQDTHLYNAARGLCWLELAFKGQTAHGGYVWKGSNAVMKASDFAQEVLRRYPTPTQELWGTTANIASIHTSNETFNRIPDNAIIKIDFRFTAEDPIFQDRESVEAFVRSIDPEAEIVDYHTMEQAVHVDEHNFYLQTLAASLEQTIGKKPEFKNRSGGSDGRHFATVGNDVVEYGITGHDPHGDQEYIEIDQINPYRVTLQRFLTSLR
jgi:succinyl-diaminopimelate desuccinylase